MIVDHFIMLHSYLIKNGLLKNISKGINHYNILNNSSIHAEVAAFNNLKFCRETQYIDLLVIRVNKSKNLCNSKPCSKCIMFMNTTLKKRNYIVSTIYYSNDNGDIVKTKLNNL